MLPSRSGVEVVFGVGLLCSAYLSSRHYVDGAHVPSSKLAERLRLNGAYPGPNGKESYNVTGVPAGYGLMFVAGALSGLLGIGSGAVKVLAMDRAMKISFEDRV